MNITEYVEAWSFWPHQQEAIKTIKSYLDEYAGGQPSGSCLVNMPTGSGKSGVIAAASQFFRQSSAVLVIVPRITLREQLAADIQSRFWNHLECGPNEPSEELPKDVVELESSSDLVNNEDLTGSILVATAQLVSTIFRYRNKSEHKYHEEFDRLSDAVSMVIFDEGHYKPAPKWGKVTRALNAPTILFTATPFRNDLKIFNIDENQSKCLTFHRAVDNGYIRDVNFHQCSYDGNAADFVDETFKKYQEIFDKSPSDTGAPRAIIRCDDHHHILQIGKALDSKNVSWVGIHENFDDNESTNKFQHVPGFEETEAVFWVHQFKLLEGVDDSRFELLSLYGELKNGRSLVQQVGRVIRNPDNEPEATAHVLDFSGGDQEARWKNFLSYDHLLKKHGLKVLRLSERLLEALQEAFPDVVYMDGRFRSPGVLESIEEEDLLLPTRTSVLQTPMSANEIASEYREELEDEEDCAVEVLNTGNTVSPQIILYVRFRTSRHLDERYFVEPRFNVVLIHKIDGYLFCLDTGSSRLSELDLEVQVIDSKSLKSLFDKGNTLTDVNLLNSDVGADVVRSKEIRAVDVGDLAHSFEDSRYVCSRVTGRTSVNIEGDERTRRRYVGLSTARVSDSSASYVKVNEYVNWLEEISGSLKGANEPPTAFRRYGREVERPDDPEPQNILLDIADLEERCVLNDDGKGQPEAMRIDRHCQDINNEGKFTVNANGENAEVSIEYDEDRKRYELECDRLSLYEITDGAEEKWSLLNFLNRYQSFRVIPESPGVIYTRGSFYSPSIDFGKEYDDERTGILSTLIPVEELEHVSSEKGSSTGPGKGWSDGCLFDLIDSRGGGTGLENYLQDPSPDILVCDDMGDEFADFIAIWREKSKRVAFIHAKAGSKKSLKAASPLQDVCSQAVKNLGELGAFEESRTEKVNKWSGDWVRNPNNGQRMTVDERMRCDVEAEEAWEVLRKYVQNPTVDREVWIVLGQTLSKRKLEEQLTSANPANSAVQSGYLLFSTSTTVASSGCDFRVFCYGN